MLVGDKIGREIEGELDTRSAERMREVEDGEQAKAEEVEGSVRGGYAMGFLGAFGADNGGSKPWRSRSKESKVLDMMRGGGDERVTY